MVENILLLIIIGLIAGTIGSLMGLGGGVIIIPALLFLSNVSPHFQHLTPAIIVGTSYLLVILTACSSTISYAKLKRVDFQSGWLFFLSCGPGAILGAYLTSFFDVDQFSLAFGIFMVFVTIILFIKNRIPKRSIRMDVVRTLTDASGETYTIGYRRSLALTFSFFIGVISGLFGVGGGSLFVPLMVIVFQYSPHIATATSMFTILLTSMSGSLIHLFQGNIDWYAVLCLAPGAWLGGKWGAWISNRLTSTGLLNVLRIGFLVIAFRMMMKGLQLI